MAHRTAAELEAGLGHVEASPRERGTVRLVCRRPGIDEREILEEGLLDPASGLVGDGWRERGSGSTPDGSSDPDKQVTVVNARLIGLLAGDPERWALSGDQLSVDLDLSVGNLPPGTRLSVGEAVIEVTEPPHLGCAKFARRFGRDALRFVNSGVGRELRLRGMNARVVEGGSVRPGDPVAKLADRASPRRP